MRLKAIILLLVLPALSLAVKCLDCVGKDCLGAFCEGDYCVMSWYAPRWGSHEWGKRQIVKGCMSGSMIRGDISDHCEAADERGKEPFTCFCNSRDNCNGGRKLKTLRVEKVELVTCACNGEHCDGRETCLGEMCNYVKNHKSGKVAQGCINASIPVMERRSMGSCMMPPITGSLHHDLAKDAQDLLMTESCLCGTDYCNIEKPKITSPETQKCSAFVITKMMGHKVASRNVTCTGEFCFKAHIVSNLGHMSEYKTMGCASFTGEDPLAEEMNANGCAKFSSEQLSVSTCFTTKDKNALGRARANQQVRDLPKSKGRTTVVDRNMVFREPEMEIDYESEEDDREDLEEELEEMEEKERKPQRKTKTKEPKKEEVEEEEEEYEEEKETKPVEKAVSKAPKESKAETEDTFIFQKPTQPPIPDDSNTTMIALFILLMLCIVVSGAVWKFELHKKLMRSNYDTVAGG